MLLTEVKPAPGLVWPWHPELMARPVPRYTSYPTAMEFGEGIGSDAVGRAIADLPAATDVSLYVHIPYCHQICWYCGCNTGAANRTHRLEAYRVALDQELVMAARQLGGRARVRRIAFGGGSPNALAPVDFVRLVDRLLILFSADDPVLSIEIDPRSFSLDWALVLAATRVSRVSLGVQTFAPHVQAAIGRIQPLAMIEEAMAALRLRGIEQVNFDLMYGLPGQTLGDLETTVEQAIALRPTRVALFGYAHLPAMLPRQRRIDDSNLPDAALRFLQAERGYELLTAAGYVPVGFDHFALPHDALAIAAAEGRVRRNFQGFTEDGADVMLGFGASAIGKLPGLLYQNAKNAGAYRDTLAAGRLPVERGVAVSAEDAAAARVIEQLLCQGATDVPAAMLAARADRLAPFAERGLIETNGDRIAITDGGRPYARLVASCFDRFRTVV